MSLLRIGVAHNIGVRQRQFGGVWLGNKLFEKLGLDEYFSPQIKPTWEEVDWPSVIKILILSRFCRPSSELYFAEHFYEQAAFEDFLGIPAAKIYDNRLYRGLDKLLPHKCRTWAKSSYATDIESKQENNEGEIFGTSIINLGMKMNVPTPKIEFVFNEIQKKFMN